MQQQWSVMEQMYKANKTRAIGVSNYCKACLDCIAKTGTIVPHVNQIQLHVGMGISTITQGLTALCKQRGIVPQARKKTTKPMCLEAVIVVTVQHGKCTSSALQQQPTQAACLFSPLFPGPLLNMCRYNSTLTPACFLTYSLCACNANSGITGESNRSVHL